jgi:type IV secretory pathway TrbF-like protein
MPYIDDRLVADSKRNARRLRNKRWLEVGVTAITLAIGAAVAAVWFALLGDWPHIDGVDIVGICGLTFTVALPVCTKVFSR